LVNFEEQVSMKGQMHGQTICQYIRSAGLRRAKKYLPFSSLTYWVLFQSWLIFYMT